MKKLILLFSAIVLTGCIQTKIDTSSAEAFVETSDKVMEQLNGTAAEERELRRMLSEFQVAFGMSEMSGLFGGGSSRKNAKFEEALNSIEGKTADDLIKMLRDSKK
ncbi:DUF6694 family lipoprotein [Limnobacter sp.]|uniref:DUF6694 family lipoprotein n=1 Tax=Limnobacter sp. TaxID=2003368 RepID=UPI003512BDE8